MNRISDFHIGKVILDVCISVRNGTSIVYRVSLSNLLKYLVLVPALDCDYNQSVWFSQLAPAHLGTQQLVLFTVPEVG